MASWYYGRYFPPSRPLEAKGGIKAQSKRGSFGQSWWAKRWIAVLESFNIGARLGRGRNYARKGRVLSINIEKGRVTARVQGSRSQPYEVTIDVKTLAEKDVKKLSKALSQQAVFLAKLLAGEMPDNIEELFEKSKLSLFPKKRGDLQTECSCPDWSNPCKHIAAVYYLVGEEFHRDPFLIFTLRGIEREDLVGSVAAGSIVANEDSLAVDSQVPEAKDTLLPPQPLSADPSTFWGPPTEDNVAQFQAAIPAVSAALPKRLGSFPLWRGEENFLDAMETAYKTASQVGQDVVLGEYRTRKKA